MSTVQELRAIEEDATAALMGERFDHAHWLGLVIDLARELRHTMESRLSGKALS